MQVQCLFRLNYPRAVHVSLLGEFNRWSTTATPMCRREDGTWEAAIELPPGRHRYCYFVVDGAEAAGEDGYAEGGGQGTSRLRGESADHNYLQRLGIVNLGSELCVPSEGAGQPQRMELLN